jgi:hypothetical protein
MEAANSILAVIGLITIVGACGASFTFGVAVVCRRMKWAPINITVNVRRIVVTDWK